jgi:hypothetical protein
LNRPAAVQRFLAQGHQIADQHRGHSEHRDHSLPSPKSWGKASKPNRTSPANPAIFGTTQQHRRLAHLDAPGTHRWVEALWKPFQPFGRARCDREFK